jgi:hypothetical protein
MSIASALMSGDPDQTQAAIDYETLRHAVQRTIQCPVSGVVLDVRRAVLLTVTTADGDATRSKCIDGEAWDKRTEQMRAACEEAKAKLEVIDGRNYTAAGKLRKVLPRP